MRDTIKVLSFDVNFLFKFISAKTHSQKSFSRFFCDASVPIPNGHTIYEICLIVCMSQTSDL